MDIYDFVDQLGKCKTSAGYKFSICYTKPRDSEYPIVGYIHFSDTHKSLFEFDVEGYPKDRQLNHGLNLNPVVPITKYKMIDPKELKDYTKIKDFMKDFIEV